MSWPGNKTEPFFCSRPWAKQKTNNCFATLSRSEAIPLFHVNFSAPHISSSTEMASCEVVALGDGFVDGLLIFWELEVWPGLPHYSTDPYNRCF